MARTLATLSAAGMRRDRLVTATGSVGPDHAGATVAAIAAPAGPAAVAAPAGPAVIAAPAAWKSRAGRPTGAVLSPTVVGSGASRRPGGPRILSTSSSNASQTCAADWGRSAGDFAPSQPTQSEMRGSRLGTRSLTRGRGSLIWRSTIPKGSLVSPNGVRPTSSSNAVTPTAYRSVHGPR